MSPTRTSANVRRRGRVEALQAELDLDARPGLDADARDRSSRVRLSWTFPNRSTISTCARTKPSPITATGTSRRTSEAGSSGGPELRGSTPAARCAAAGANTSRPWNVRETGSRRYAGFSSSHAPAMPPSRSAAGHEQPVVRPDVEPAVRAAQRQRLPLGADAGIDDRQVHALRHVRKRAGEDERSLEHLLRLDAVGDVDDVRVRRDPLHHPVTRADEVVLEPEVASGT